MSEITFISNKTKKALQKYLIVSVIAFLSWILQISIASRFMVMDTSLNLFLLGTIYFGISMGPVTGSFFGILSSFFSTSILYDHTFYFSYPVIGFLAGIISKNLIADELLFFTALSLVFVFLLELLNGFQFSINKSVNFLERYLLILPGDLVLNIVLAPIYYIGINFFAKKLKLRL